MLGWLLLFALTALAALAALGVTVRAEPEGRAEAGVLSTAVFFALVVTPVMALGYTNLLRPVLLAPLSILVSGAAFAGSARGRGIVDHARASARLAAGLALLPEEAFAQAVRARSFVVVGLATAAMAIAVSAWLTYLAPSESWDGLFYHEPIIGYAIQNQGFRMVSLPDKMVVQGINGYPKLCESFALWFVVFTDKTLVEIGNTVAAPGLVLAMFVLARRYCPDPVPCMGWGAALLLVPAMLTQLRTSMLDVECAFFLLAAVHFATRETYRVRDALSAALCMALVMGTKSSALVWVPPVALVAYGRLILAHARQRPGAALGAAAGGSLLTAGVGALTFVRNWQAFGNPLWPVRYDNPKLHIAWRGIASLAEVTPDPPLGAVIATKYAHPTGGVADIIARDYGYGVPWVVVPLAAAALVAAIVVAARGRLRDQPDRPTENLLLVVLLGAAFARWSPSLNIARYNGPVVAIAMAMVAWLAGRLRDAARFHEGALAATLVLSIVPWFWWDWFFGLDSVRRDVPALVSMPAIEREARTLSWEMPPKTARARDQEIGPGDLVVYTQDLSFPGVLWNHAMSNRVEYVAFTSPPAFLEAIDALAPRWVVVGEKSAARTELAKLPEAWEYVGPALAMEHVVAFRRRPR